MRVVEALLAHGADQRAGSQHGVTPLIAASRHNHGAVVRLLNRSAGMPQRQAHCLKCAAWEGADSSRALRSFKSHAEAQKAASVAWKEHGVVSLVFACRHGPGWHLRRDGGPGFAFQC